MNFYQRLLFFLLVVVLWSLVVASVGSANDKSQECQNETMSLLEDLVSVYRPCALSPSSNLPQLSASPTESEYRTYVKVFCASLPSLEHCLSEESHRWSRCRNQTLNKVFGIFREVVESTLRNTCEDQGDKLATIVQGFNHHTFDYKARNSFVRECVIFPTIRIKTSERSSAGVSSKLWYLYYELQNFKDCLGANIQDDEHFVNTSVHQINSLLNTIKCIHPANESVVLCKDIDTSVVDRVGLCPLKTKSKLAVPLSLVVEIRATSCFAAHYDPYSPTLSAARDGEEFREYFKRYCRHQNEIKHCFLETALAAEVCLNEAGFQIFKLVWRYFDLVLEYGCFEEGRRLATVMYKQYTLRDLSNNNESLLSCLAEVQAKRSHNMDDLGRVYTYFQELPVIRACLLDKVGMEDTNFQTDVSEFIEGMMQNMDCIHPQNNTVVRCRTINNTS